MPSPEFGFDELKVDGFVFPLAPVLRGEGTGVRGNWSEVDTGENANVDGNGSTKLMRPKASKDRCNFSQ